MGLLMADRGSILQAMIHAWWYPQGMRSKGEYVFRWANFKLIYRKQWIASNRRKHRISKIKRWSDNTTFEASATHSLPTPITAWIPWASLSAPRGPVFIDVWTISSRSLGKFCILSATIPSFSIHSSTWIIWMSKNEKNSFFKHSKNTLAGHTIKKRKYHLITQSMKFQWRDKQPIPPF